MCCRRYAEHVSEVLRFQFRTSDLISQWRRRRRRSRYRSRWSSRWTQLLSAVHSRLSSRRAPTQPHQAETKISRQRNVDDQQPWAGRVPRRSSIPFQTITSTLFNVLTHLFAVAVRLSGGRQSASCEVESTEVSWRLVAGPVRWSVRQQSLRLRPAYDITFCSGQGTIPVTLNYIQYIWLKIV